MSTSSTSAATAPKAGRLLASARDDRLLSAFVVVGALLLALASLREYMKGGSYVAAPDYLAEMLPPINALRDDGFRGFVEHLPGYPGAAMIEYVPAQIAVWLGLNEATTWRFISTGAIAILGLAVLSAVSLARAGDASRGAARAAVLLAVASPAAYWALRIGHPEEIFSTGLLLGAVIAAAREKPIMAGLLLGLAVGKAWPAVAALPVLGLLLPDPIRVAKGMAAAAWAAGMIFILPLLFAGSSVAVMTDLGQSGIFNVGQVFWWFGDPLADSIVATQGVPQPRGHGPVWSGELSHPLILGVGTAIGLIWCWSLYGRLTRSGQISVLREDGRTRSGEETAQLAAAALLVMAGILYARCFLDTWNIPYYLLPALVLGALGEMLSGRRPILTLIATGLMWKWHAPGDLTVRSDPDIYTALYLSWTIPFGIAFVVRGFQLAKGVVLPAARTVVGGAAGAKVPLAKVSAGAPAARASAARPDAPTP